MLQSEYERERFYIFAMELFSKSGHILTSFPEYTNHSPEQFVFFDNASDVVLSQEQRLLFKVFSNVSRLFTVNDCAFFSINLLTAKNSRSQVAHDIHIMIHSIIGSKGTICLFRCDNEVMISFYGFGYRCILSDWYPMEDDIDCLSEKLDIANMSIEREDEYFNDMIYSLARDYYLHNQPTTFELLPIDFFLKSEEFGVGREEIDRQIKKELTAPQRSYGSDYVEYDEFEVFTGADTNTELDLLILEIDNDDDNSFDEKINLDEEYLNENASISKIGENTEKDYYEFDNVDPEIFQDPSLMVKWLDKLE